FRADDLEDVARLWDLAHSGDHDRCCGWCFGRAAPAVIGEGPHPTVDVPAHEVVANLQRSCLHEHCGDRTPAPLQVGIDDRPDGVPVRVRLELQDATGTHARG